MTRHPIFSSTEKLLKDVDAALLQLWGSFSMAPDRVTIPARLARHLRKHYGINAVEFFNPTGRKSIRRRRYFRRYYRIWSKLRK